MSVGAGGGVCLLSSSRLFPLLLFLMLLPLLFVTLVLWNFQFFFLKHQNVAVEVIYVMRGCTTVI